MDEVEIVSLIPDEWQKAYEIRVESVRNEPCAFGQSVEQAVATSENEWRTRLSRKEYLFAKHNNTIVGIACVVTEGAAKVQHVGIIFSVYVKSEYRGKGVGKKLLQAILELAKERKLLKVRLYAAVTQKTAIALYESLGFYKMADFKQEMLIGEKYIDEIAMEKFL